MSAVPRWTPGPWTYGAFGDVWTGIELRDGKWDETSPGSAKIVLSLGKHDGLPAEANGILAATAPDLYDALQECADALMDFAPSDQSTETGWKNDEAAFAWKRAQDVLAKARGEAP